jgi:hypothetical protein
LQKAQQKRKAVRCTWFESLSTFTRGWRCGFVKRVQSTPLPPPPTGHPLLCSPFEVQFLVLLILNMSGLSYSHSCEHISCEFTSMFPAFMDDGSFDSRTHTRSPHLHCRRRIHPRIPRCVLFLPISFESIASLHELIGTFFRLPPWQGGEGDVNIEIAEDESTRSDENASGI